MHIHSMSNSYWLVDNFAVTLEWVYYLMLSFCVILLLFTYRTIQHADKASISKLFNIII